MKDMEPFPDEREIATQTRILSTASDFAERTLARPIDEIAIRSATLIDTEQESWLVYARSDRGLLFIEVVVGPGDQMVARRLDPYGGA